MPTTRIPFDPETTYHIWTHANGEENLFRCNENFRYFLAKYVQYIHPVAETFAYCLMPNHVHMMIQVRSEDSVLRFLRERKPTLQGFETPGGFSAIISRQFSHFFNGYTQAYNRMYDRKGSLFIPNFRRKPIHTEAYFSKLVAYIHNNPVHHGFVKEIGDWPHSSWHSYVMDKPSRISRQEVLDWFGGIAGFISFHENIETKDELATLDI